MSAQEVSLRLLFQSNIIDSPASASTVGVYFRRYALSQSLQDSGVRVNDRLWALVALSALGKLSALAVIGAEQMKRIEFSCLS